MSANKSRILYIKRFLEENTDENHPATIADIVNYLSGKGIPASRQTVAREIEEPTDAGMDIICTAGRPGGYFVGGRLFELPELKLLIDAAHASRFIPPRKAAALIGKLSGFASKHQAVELRRSLYTDKLARPRGR